MARFAGGSAPFLRLSDNKNQGTGVIMRDFIIALIPVILFAWYKNGILVYMQGNINLLEMLWPLIFIIVGGLSSVIMELIFFYITSPKNERTFKHLMQKEKLSYGVIPGLILALMLPVYTPIWVLLFGCFIANIVGKMIFGGFGYNIFNPALLGYAAIKFGLMGVITSAGGYFNVSEALIDSYGGATPLATLQGVDFLSYSSVVAPYGNLWDFFIGLTPGGMGETGFMIMIVSYLWLSARKVIRWQTPLLYVGLVFILSWLVGIMNGQSEIWFPLYSIFTGGVMFGAVFMITEPVTTPKNPLGKTVFVIFLAVLTVLFRYVGSLPEGVGTSIIVMNIFALPIDKYTSIIRSNRWKEPALAQIIVIFGILLALATYTMLKAGTVYSMLISLMQIGGGF
jgi:electron transport complex protein RnfD